MSTGVQPITIQDSVSDAGVIRVAYIVCKFDMGGLERCVARLCNHLDRDRFIPMVICLERSGDAAQWIERDDVEIIELNKKPRNDLGVIWRLARTLREKQVDVVHSHNWGTLVETTLARRWAGTPVHVHTEHGQGLHHGLSRIKQLLHKIATRWAFRNANCVTVCAESVQEIISQRVGFDKSQFQFIPNGVERAEPTVDRSVVRESLGIGNDDIVFGSVGRLVPVKNFQCAIQATVGAVQAGYPAHLILVGDGPDRLRLQELSASLGAEDYVHLVGQQTQVANWLNAFDVYINSSNSEAMSLGILEAMSAGLPIVATNVGDNAQLVESEMPCGVVVEKDNAESMRAALVSLISNPDILEQHSSAAADKYRLSYSVDKMGVNYSNTYGSHLQSPSRTRQDGKS